MIAVLLFILVSLALCRLHRPPMKITVSFNSRKSDSFGSYVAYKVGSVDLNSEPGSISELAVIRRYSDFEWLYSHLVLCYPGVIMPVLPAKRRLGRFNVDFIEHRRRGLEGFLARLSSHSSLGAAPLFTKFLQCDDIELAKVKEDLKASKKKVAAIVTEWIEGTVNNLSHPKIEIEKSLSDVKIEEITQYVTALEQQMLLVSRHSENLVRRSREIAQAYCQFGDSIASLGRSEGGTIGSALQEVGSTSRFLSDSAAKYAEVEAREFEEPLDEYVRLIASVKSALQQRVERRNTYIAAILDVDVKKQTLNRLAATPGKEDLVLQKQELQQRAERVMEAAKADFDQVSDRLLVEFEDFKRQKAKEMRSILLNFISLQIEYSRSTETVWNELSSSLQSAMPREDDDLLAEELTGEYRSIHPETFVSGDPNVLMEC